MKNSDVIITLLSAVISEIATDPAKYVVNPGRDFTRNRKLGFRNTLIMLFTMEADGSREEIYCYFGRSADASSKTAFYRQRRKLNKEAFANPLCTFNDILPVKPYKGTYRFIACDSSAVDVFATWMILIPSLNQTENPPGVSVRFTLILFTPSSTGGLPVS